MQRMVKFTIYLREEKQTGDKPWLSRGDYEEAIWDQFSDFLGVELENYDVDLDEEE